MKTSLTDIERGRRKVMEGRVLLCALGLILPVLLLLIRLWQVQALQGPELSQNADRQSLRRRRPYRRSADRTDSGLLPCRRGRQLESHNGIAHLPDGG